MTIIYHRQFQRDLSAALRFYDEEGGSKLGDRFFDEEAAVTEKVGSNPKGFHFIAEGMRRAQLQNFPYLVIFEENAAKL